MDQIHNMISFDIGRLDVLLVNYMGFSRNRIQQLIADGCVRVNNKIHQKSSYKLKKGDEITICVPKLEEFSLEAEDIPLDIVYEDEHLIVLNKASDMVVHPSFGHLKGTLVNALLHHCGKSLSNIGGKKRPGIVHRLDLGTSGLMVVAKTDQAHLILSSQFSDRSLTRTYHALVYQIPKPFYGEITTIIGRSPFNRKKMSVLSDKKGKIKKGKMAITLYRVLKVYSQKASLVECQLKTGRTHQIRVHMAHLGHGVIGDSLYGKKHLKLFDEQEKQAILGLKRQALHARYLEFNHPMTGEKMFFESEFPCDILEVELHLQYKQESIL